MNQYNKRSRDDETNNTSTSNKKSKGEDENERKDQEIERLRQEIAHQRQANERHLQKIERQQQDIEHHRQQLRHYVQCKISDCSTCQDIECNDGQHVDVPCIHCGDLGSFYQGQSTMKKTVDFLRDFPGKKPLVLDRDEANQWIKDVPQELWQGEIMPYFSVKELSLGSTIAKHFQKYWVTFKTKRKWCVPKDFPSLREAVRLGEILSGLFVLTLFDSFSFYIIVSTQSFSIRPILGAFMQEMAHHDGHGAMSQTELDSAVSFIMKAADAGDTRCFNHSNGVCSECRQI